MVSAIKEDHKKAIYSVTFNPFLQPNTNPVFATVGGRQLTIYQCNIHGEPGGTTVLQTFQDPDETEVFYTSAWGILGDNPIIAFAGEHGSIRILSIINTQVWNFYFEKQKSCFLDRSPFDWSRVIYK